jgi:hypothetical protein
MYQCSKNKSDSINFIFVFISVLILNTASIIYLINQNYKLKSSITTHNYETTKAIRKNCIFSSYSKENPTTSTSTQHNYYHQPPITVNLQSVSEILDNMIEIHNHNKNNSYYYYSSQQQKQYHDNNYNQTKKIEQKQQQEAPDISQILPAHIIQDIYKQNAFHRYYQVYLEPYCLRNRVTVLDVGAKLVDLWIQYFEFPNYIHAITFSSPSSILSKEQQPQLQKQPHNNNMFFSDSSSSTITTTTTSSSSTSSTTTNPHPFLKYFHVDTNNLVDTWFITNNLRGKYTYDVIIDDSTRHPSHQILAFENLFPLLKPGGLYIIQGIHTSYWSQPGVETSGYSLFGAGIRKKSNRNSVEKFKQIIDTLQKYHIVENKNSHTMTAFQKSYADSDIFSVTFGQSIILIHKSTISQQQHNPDIPQKHISYIIQAQIQDWIQDVNLNNDDT